MARLNDRPDMTLDVYRGCETTIQQQQQNLLVGINSVFVPNINHKSPYACQIEILIIPFSEV